MNLLDATVIDLLGKPYKKFGTRPWWVDVKYTCYGKEGVTTLMYKTEEEVNQVKEGLIIQV